MAPARASRRGGTPVRAAALLASVVVLALPSLATAAGAPQVQATWASNVAATSASLHAETNPEGLATTLRLEYLTQSAYEANLAAAKEGFAGATRSPATGGVFLGSGEAPIDTLRQITSLTPATTYRYRAVATNSVAPGGITSQEHTFTTQPSGAVFSLPDARGWEMVSPVDKNGGAVQGPGENFGGDLLQAAALGGGVTYSSASSFGQGAQGAPAASQYLAGRGGGGWSTLNLTVPLRSEAEPAPTAGVPYRLFSADLTKALMFSGGHCSSPGVGCANPSPPLAGSGAPSGYQDYYLRGANGAYEALITQANAPGLTLPAEAFEVRLAGAGADLSHVVLATCAKLTAEATEACPAGGPNLYAWSNGSVALVNSGVSDAHLAAPSGAISSDGNRVYFSASEDGSLYLREGNQVRLVSQPGDFQIASTDGSVAFYTKANHLFRYQAKPEETTDLTPSGEVQGVLGVSADGAYLYYESASGLKLWHEGTITPVAPGADAVNWPPSTGQARVSADGTKLLFSSSASLTGYDNAGAQTKLPVAELFLYDAASKQTACASCNPTGERPSGSSSVPGALANGVGEEATQAYKPRPLSADGNRVFFDSSDSLALQDTNGQTDVYQWEAPGEGSCVGGTLVNAGCVSLLSSGRDSEPSEFIDASTDGSDAFFLTAASLVKADPGSVDLYDARVGGGYAVPPTPIPCEGDACQALLSEPEDPTPGTLVAGDPNPPLHYIKEGTGHHKGKKGKGHHKKGHHKKGHHKKGHHKKGHKGKKKGTKR
jgi:hypothetical protein